jgi:hypothetical protein
MSSEELQRRYLGIGFVDVEAGRGELPAMRELR